MTGWIDLVESVRQHTHRLVAVLQSTTVCTDIDAISQTTDYQHIGNQSSEVTDKVVYQILTIGGAVACTYNINDMALIEVCRTFIIEHDGSIVTLSETLWIVIIIQTQGTDTTLLHKLHLGSSTLEGLIPILHRLTQTRRGIRHDIA